MAVFARLVTRMLWGINEFVLLSVVVTVFVVVIEIGFRLGRRHRDRSDDDAKAHCSALQAALLGLLALLLGFTFAMAVSRFDTRKSLVLEEANAIRRTALRARLLPPPQRQELAALLRSYVAACLDFYNAESDTVRREAANASAARLEEHIWTLASAVAAQDPRSAPTGLGLFLQSLNEMIDLHEKNRTALDNHVPGTVLALLFAVSVGALGFIAYGCGLTGQRRHGSTAIFALMIALVLTLILDMDRPRRGLIRVSQESLVRLQAALEQSTP